MVLGEQGENKSMARAATGTTRGRKTGLKGRSSTNGSTTKEPQAVDPLVGSRIRMRRMMVGISQEKLGDACGITFQQIQKYEKGTNRIGASRLHQLARILEVPVEFFYEGATSDQNSGGPSIVDQDARSITEFLATPEGLALVRAFMAVPEKRLRRRIVELARAVAAGEE
jgi:transcriptional regulator with XRE-family HTH domain